MSRLIDAIELNGYKFGLISTYAQELFHDTINSAPTIKAIPLDKVRQAREKIASSLNGLDTQDYAEKVAKFYIERDLRILDELIESEG